MTFVLIQIETFVWPISGPHSAQTNVTDAAKNGGPEVVHTWANTTKTKTKPGQLSLTDLGYTKSSAIILRSGPHLVNKP